MDPVVFIILIFPSPHATFPLFQICYPPSCPAPRKEQASQRHPLNMGKQDTIRPDINSYMTARSDSPAEGMGSQKQAKETETPPLPLSGIPPKHQANNYNILS